MKPSQANANLLEALPAALRALKDFRDYGYSSDSFCYGQQGEIGTSEVLGALRALQRWVEENAADDNDLEMAVSARFSRDHSHCR